MRLRDLISWKRGLRARLAEDGAVVVRQFLSVERTQELKAVANGIYDEMADCSDFPHDAMASQYRDWRAVWMNPLPEFLAARNKSLGERFEDGVTDIIALTRKKFGREWQLLRSHSFFRRHIGLGRAVAWHIDADEANLGRERCINVWLPLDDVGTSLPSLDIIPKSHLKVRQTPFREEPNKRNEFVATLGPTLTPVLQAGDGLVFDQYTLHRTQLLDSEQIVRTSCEFRFWAA